MNLFQMFKKLTTNSILNLFVFFLPLLAAFSTCLSASEIVIPPEMGRVTRQSENLPSAGQKTLVLIQESHSNYEVQKGIAAILEHLILKHNLRLILVEGGWGDVTLSSLRELADEAARREVSEKYLREGLISGEEYLNVVKDYPMVLWGVEDPALYGKNMEVFLAVQDRQAELLAESGKLKALIAGLYPEIYTPELLELQKKTDAFDAGELPFIEYVRVLVQFSGRPENLAGFPHLQKIAAMAGLGGTFDIEKIQFEKNALVRRLTQTMTRPEFERLALPGETADAASEQEYLEKLTAAAKRYLGKDSVSGNLEAYAHALAVMQKTDPEVLFGELTRLCDAVAASLMQTGAQKNLWALAEKGRTLEKLFGLKLVPAEFEVIEKNPEDFHMDRWREPLENLSEGEGIVSSPAGFSLNQHGEVRGPMKPSSSPNASVGDPDSGLLLSAGDGSVLRRKIPGEDKNNGREKTGVNRQANKTGLDAVNFDLLSEWLPRCLDFYRSAREREDAIIRHAAAQIEAGGNAVTALIAGGFHTQIFEKKFKEQGLHVVTVTPKFSAGDLQAQHDFYLKVLKTKWQGADTVSPKPAANLNQGRI